MIILSVYKQNLIENRTLQEAAVGPIRLELKTPEYKSQFSQFQCYVIWEILRVMSSIKSASAF